MTPRATPLRRFAAAAAFACLAAQLGAGSLVLAAPSPWESGPAGARRADARRAGAARLGDFGGRDAFCGTHDLGLVDVVERHAARAGLIPYPAPLSTDAGEIAVLEDDSTFFYLNDNGAMKVDLQAVAQAFYRTHGDDYDVLAVFLSSGLTDWLGSPTAFAASFVVRNDIQGIGLPLFDESAGFGSAGRLSAILSMNGLQKYPEDPFADIPGSAALHSLDALGHELGHRWLAYPALDSLGTGSLSALGRGLSHWSFFFDSDGSIMEGNDWWPLGPDSFTTGPIGIGYGRVDQYLMGLRTAAEVGTFATIGDLQDPQPPGAWRKISIPMEGFGCSGVANAWMVANIEGAEGPRVPPAGVAPTHWRMAVVLLTERGLPASPADLAKLEAMRSNFPAWFAAATEGRGTIDVTLDSQPGSLAIDHAGLADTEDLASPRTFGARVRVVPRGLPVAVDPGSVTLHHRGPGGGPFQPHPMTPVAPDSFEVSIPVAPGEHEYFLTAQTQPPGTGASSPPGAPLALHAFVAGPDLAPPVVTHVPVPRQASFRMPQTLLARVRDNASLGSAWAEVSVNGGPLQVVPAIAAGTDSFSVALGAGLPVGAKVAYRFVARDGSAALNIGASNAGFDTLEVARDAHAAFENGAEGFTHGPLIWSYRDAWRLAPDPFHPERGTTWFSGGPEPGVPYAPKLDGGLLVPWLYGVPAAARLVFDHRYDLEEYDATYGWDLAFVEAWNGSAWQQLQPLVPYSHALASKVSVVPSLTPGWSGSSGGWRTESFDLSPLAGATTAIRFRMLTDTFFGREGWYVDDVRIVWADGVTSAPVPLAGATLLGPNPARDHVRLALTLPRGGEVRWDLYDVAGRRVATLWRGELAAGPTQLEARLPREVGAGLYFARVSADGRAVRTDRVAVVR